VSTPTPGSVLDLPGALRRLRADETPYPGLLCGGGTPTVRVEADSLPDILWRAERHGHLLAPVEIARTADGHAAVLPHCPRRLRDHIDGGALTDGQMVTVTVSILRAAREADALGIACGTWWIDHTGRPVLAAGTSSAWREEAAELLALMGESGGAPVPVITKAAAALGDPRALTREGDRCEDALFSTCPPAPLTEPAGHARAPTPLAHTALRPEPHRSPAALTETWLSRLIDAEVARQVGRAVTVVGRGAIRMLPRRTPRAPSAPPSAEERRRSHRAPVLLGAAVAAVVLGVGTLWPDAPTADMRRGVPAATAPATPTATPTEGTTAAGGSPGTVEDDARRAIAGLASCAAGDADACARVREDASRPMPEGLVASGQPADQVTVLDEYGGVAVVRADAEGHTSQVVVLVAAREGWLVRDVYDIADQP